MLWTSFLSSDFFRVEGFFSPLISTYSSDEWGMRKANLYYVNHMQILIIFFIAIFQLVKMVILSIFAKGAFKSFFPVSYLRSV